MSESKQMALHPPNDPKTPATVYVVVTNYDGDPHPHVEGVFENEDSADELMEQCAARYEPPYPVAWQKTEQEVEDE